MPKHKIKFIVDECTGSNVARWLLEKGFNVLSIYDEMQGIKDIEILEIAQIQDWVIISNVVTEKNVRIIKSK